MKVLFMYILPSGGMNTLNRVRARALRGAGIESHLLFLRTGSGMGDIEPDIPVSMLPNLKPSGKSFTPTLTMPSS